MRGLRAPPTCNTHLRLCSCGPLLCACSWNALMAAARNGHSRVVKLLLQNPEVRAAVDDTNGQVGSLKHKRHPMVITINRLARCRLQVPSHDHDLCCPAAAGRAGPERAVDGMLEGPRRRGTAAARKGRGGPRCGGWRGGPHVQAGRSLSQSVIDCSRCLSLACR